MQKRLWKIRHMFFHPLAGMIVGAAILFVFGAVWLLLGVVAKRPSPRWLRATLLLMGFGLGACIAGTGVRVSGSHPAIPSPMAEQTAKRRQIGRQFGWVTGIEGAAILLTVVVLNVVRRPEYIASVIALIVGLHFFPLTKLFGAPHPYLIGFLGYVIGVGRTAHL